MGSAQTQIHFVSVVFLIAGSSLACSTKSNSDRNNEDASVSSGSGSGTAFGDGSSGSASGNGQVLTGQLVTRSENRRWLYYDNEAPHFLCAAGDPEDFLYRGSRNADGTRTGDQDAIIDKMVGTGTNGIYIQVIRSHGGDGNASHNPFMDSDPSKGLDEEILSQWDEWFSALDKAGVVTYLFVYDDGSCIWGCNKSTDSSVPSEERTFLQSLVERFSKHPLLVWVIAEEYAERFNAQRVSAIADVIRGADAFHHPIAVHKNSGLNFGEFANDPNIDQFAIQYNVATAPLLHSGMTQAFEDANGRYNLNMSEAEAHGSGATARVKNWSIALGGAYVMVLGWDVATTSLGDLQGCGDLVTFMESTSFDSMLSVDGRAYMDSNYVLAEGNTRFIAYSATRTGSMGVKGIDAGSYDLSWFDPASRQSESETVSVTAGDRAWTPPSGFGQEVALYIRPAI